MSDFDTADIGLYVHVPFCESKCDYCGFYSVPVAGHDVGLFVDALLVELGRYDFAGGVRTVYIGGGSPSCLPVGQLCRLIEGITSRVGGAGEEFTVEANPGQLDAATLKILHALGVNRLSLGLQSFEQSELAVLGRGCRVGKVFETVAQARDAGFGNISIDLIFAIPEVSISSWRRTLDRAVELSVEHISAYSLSYEPGTALAARRDAGEIVATDEDVNRAMYELAIDVLNEAGIEQYEISNFAREGFQCLHNLNYWANEPYVGIGPSAGSYYRGQRTINISDVAGYVQAIREHRGVFVESARLSDIESACETAVLNLRRLCGINLEQFRNKTGYDLCELFAEPIARYVDLGLMSLDSERLCLAEDALAIADSILCDFSSL